MFYTLDYTQQGSGAHSLDRVARVARRDRRREQETLELLQYNAGRGLCELGAANTACGTAGVTCLSCVALGESCSNQRCTGADGGVGCGWFNCGGCCDDSGMCILVDSDANCGVQGNRCTDCAKLGARCVLGACTAPDGAIPRAQSCAGCFDSIGTCQRGFSLEPEAPVPLS